MASCTSMTLATAALLPLFKHSSSASSCASRSISSARRHSRFCRSRGRMRLQAESSKAARAAWTARSTSTLSAHGTSPSTSPVAGLRKFMVLPLCASCQSAPMRIFSLRSRKAWVRGRIGRVDSMGRRLLSLDVQGAFATTMPNMRSVINVLILLVFLPAYRKL
ncbi:hypothetical protein D3C78_866230 [compost metagenome]